MATLSFTLSIVHVFTAWTIGENRQITCGRGNQVEKPALPTLYRRASPLKGLAAVILAAACAASFTQAEAAPVPAKTSAVFDGPPFAPDTLGLEPRGPAAWDRALWTQTAPVGDPSKGQPFTIVGRPGATVRHLRVFRDAKDKYLRGIRVTFTDDTEMVAGVELSQSNDFDFGDEDAVRRMTLWAWTNKKGDRGRVGHIRFETDKASFDYGMGNLDSKRSYPVNVGSGKLIGFIGRASDGLDLLIPVFLKPISRSVIDQVELEPYSPTQGLKLSTLDTGMARWSGSPYTAHLSGSTSQTDSVSWTLGYTRSVSVGASIKWKFMDIFEAEAHAEWGRSETRSSSLSESTTRSLTWAIDHPVNGPDDEAICFAQVWVGDLDLHWTGIQTIETKDGTVGSFPVSGTMRRVARGHVIKSCSPVKSISSGQLATLKDSARVMTA
ncbi:uncharacterized protein CTHT_0022010 [Thermochaetoides thermophila DSM 1495]|uniref:Jacalin-type lectin domain-containing protein n=1 Tax=Chaetomium thermophilum (strain DSM 1495 / CBS 144.50 / IMI 039719) TaxID=759272 RepID=G0S3Z8_CHATD|nr:hypothetical protein CTHT_0022010 [Thermochaetoides thermophila DSM 1495]EGS20374.1 hypothetical protein CTHT_0022010 [Thermochaetoides thermophila DSM 1495]